MALSSLATSALTVPGVRVMKLAALASGRQPGTALDADVTRDISRVEVTRVNTGASQYSITFNNWYDATPGVRNLGHEEREVQGRARPLWPRFKYNDFGLLTFGQRLRVDMGYWPGLERTGSAGQGEPHRWVPMVSGPITDMRFNFSGGGAQLVVSGEDDLSPLKDRHEGRRITFNRLSEEGIVQRVLERSGYPLRSIASSRVAWPQFTRDNANGLDEALNEGQSFLEYLQKLAERLDFEVFTEFADVTDPDSGVEFHFEPSRSRLPPDRTLRDIFVLQRDTNLLEYAPTIKVVDQPSEFKVTGRHRDPGQPELIEGTATHTVLDDELHIDPAQGDAQLFSGPQMRQTFFPGRHNVMKLTNLPNLDRERARHLAEALLRRKAREFFTIQGTTLGLPRLRPGQHVEIRKMRPPFDGFFYVTKTVHTWGTDGFRTRFEACRPGMPKPPYNERSP